MTELQVRYPSVSPLSFQPQSTAPRPSAETPRFSDNDAVSLSDAARTLADNGTIGPNPDPPDIEGTQSLRAVATPNQSEVVTGYTEPTATPSDPARISFSV